MKSVFASLPAALIAGMLFFAPAHAKCEEHTQCTWQQPRAKLDKSTAKLAEDEKVSPHAPRRISDRSMPASAKRKSRMAKTLSVLSEAKAAAAAPSHAKTKKAAQKQATRSAKVKKARPPKKDRQLAKAEREEKSARKAERKTKRSEIVRIIPASVDLRAEGKSRVRWSSAMTIVTKAAPDRAKPRPGSKAKPATRASSVETALQRPAERPTTAMRAAMRVERRGNELARQARSVIAKAGVTTRHAEVVSIISAMSPTYNVPTWFALRIAKVESGYNPAVRGDAGEYGVFQIKCATARFLGFEGSCAELYDARTNVEWGLKHLSAALVRSGGNLKLAASKHNGGLGRRTLVPTYVERVF
jgi:soluble lytic murein transglycosylase-like protein